MVKNEYLHYRHFSFQLAIPIFWFEMYFHQNRHNIPSLILIWLPHFSFVKSHFIGYRFLLWMSYRARGAELLKGTSLTDSWHILLGGRHCGHSGENIFAVTIVLVLYFWTSQNQKNVKCERKLGHKEVLVGHMTHIYWSPRSDKKDLKTIF